MNRTYRLNPEVEIANVTETDDEKPQFLAMEPAGGEKYELGEEEVFLLRQFHDRNSAAAIIDEFESRFGLVLSEEVLAGFVSQMVELGLLQPVTDSPARAWGSAEEEPAIEAELVPPDTAEIPHVVEVEDRFHPEPDAARDVKPAREYMRFNLFNPHGLFKFFSWIFSPFTFFVWLIPIGCVLAIIVLLNNSSEYAHDVTAMRTRFGLGSLVIHLILATISIRLLSKLAQGAICCHFGGVIERFGIRMMFGMMPRLFIDKRPIRGLSRRGQLWSYAGPLLIKLSLFSGGIMTWFMIRGRGFFQADLAIFLGTIGLAGFLFTANPLWQADGYNWLTIYLRIERLRERAFTALKLFLLRRPFPPQLHSRERSGLVVFGMATVTFTLFIVVVVVIMLGITLERQLGGFGVVLFLALLASFTGWFMAQKKWNQHKAEVRNQRGSDRALARVDNPGQEKPARRQIPPGRQKKTFRRWIFGPIHWPRAIILGILGSLLFLPYSYEPGGTLTIYPAQRFELFARADGEVIDVFVVEAQVVAAGELLARLYDLDLRQSILLAKTEIEKKEAQLSLLREGSKREEVELARKKYEQARVAMDFSQKEVQRLEPLHEDGIISAQMYENALAKAGEDAAEFRVAEANLALVASGPRANEEKVIMAEIQHLEQQGIFYAEELAKRRIEAPADGRIITPKVHELRGKVLREGQLFAVIEDTSTVRVEALIPETDIGYVKLNSKVEFKMLAYPGLLFRGRVTFISPVTEEMPENPFIKAVRIVSVVDNLDGKLKSDMTGYAKVEGKEELVVVAFTKILVRFALVEMWSWLP